MKKRNVFSALLFIAVLFSGPVIFTVANAQNPYTQTSGTVTLTGQSFTASGTDISAVKVSGGTLNLSNSSCISTSNTSNSDSSSFNGLNAIMLATTKTGTAIINSSGNVLSSTGKGANGIFAYGTASVTSLNDSIYCTGQYSHAIMCSGGGTIIATNLKAKTTSGNSGAIATDRGSGTITVNGAVVSTTGQDSPGIYSTGIITVTDATISSSNSEVAVVEGENYIILNNCNLTSTKDNKWGVLLYQSMSGDANGINGYYTQTGGSLCYTGTSGPLFYNTNSVGHISLTDVDLTVNSGVLLRSVAGNWGLSNKNGGTTYFTANSQVMSGDIITDILSKVCLNMQGNSAYTGAINKANTAKLITLTMDCSSTWTVTDTSYINGLIINPCISGTSVSNIIGNGYYVYYISDSNNSLGGLTYNLVNGGYLLPYGSSGTEELNNAYSINLTACPNPFSGSTVIRFDLDQNSDAEIMILDITGKMVNKTIKENLPSGRNEISTDIDNQLQPGEYLVQFTITNLKGTKSETIKIIKK